METSDKKSEVFLLSADLFFVSAIQKGREICNMVCLLKRVNFV